MQIFCGLDLMALYQEAGAQNLLPMRAIAYLAILIPVLNAYNNQAYNEMLAAQEKDSVRAAARELLKEIPREIEEVGSEKRKPEEPREEDSQEVALVIPFEIESAVILPMEIWKKILDDIVDFWSFFSLCQTTKAFNSLMRTEYFEKMLDLVGTKEDYKAFLIKSDIGLKLKHLEFLLPAPKNMSLKKFRRRIFGKTDDLALIREVFHYSDDPQILPYINKRANKDISKHLYIVKRPDVFGRAITVSHQYIWLPPKDNQVPLFHMLDEKVVAAVNGNYRVLFRSMFLPSLLADYIIPGYHGDFDLNREELRRYSGLMRTDGCMEYFIHLFHALYILYPDYRKAMPSKWSKIRNYLRDIGFDIKRVYDNLPMNYWMNNEFRVEEEMWSIFRAAQHWGLPIKRIAERTQDWCKMSKKILAGEVPEGLETSADVTPHDVFRVAFFDPEEPVKVCLDLDTGKVLEKRRRGSRQVKIAISQSKKMQEVRKRKYEEEREERLEVAKRRRQSTSYGLSFIGAFSVVSRMHEETSPNYVPLTLPNNIPFGFQSTLRPSPYPMPMFNPQQLHFTPGHLQPCFPQSPQPYIENPLFAPPSLPQDTLLAISAFLGDEPFTPLNPTVHPEAEQLPPPRATPPPVDQDHGVSPFGVPDAFAPHGIFMPTVPSFDDGNLGFNPHLAFFATHPIFNIPDQEPKDEENLIEPKEDSI